MVETLHVRVAHVLGCRPQLRWGEWNCTCKDRAHATHTIRNSCDSSSGLNCDYDELAHYDLDWAATGPLIEKYKLSVLPVWAGDLGTWDAGWGYFQVQARGDSPLIAVCNLILKLAEIGSLTVPV